MFYYIYIYIFISYFYLGTFITEDEYGEEIWARFMDDPSHLRTVVNKLVDICNFYHFDGYLLNIENKLPYGTADFMVHFIRSLKEKLRDTVGPHTMVIWYDSIAHPSGKLKWQNKLCHSNKSVELYIYFFYFILFMA